MTWWMGILEFPSGACRILATSLALQYIETSYYILEH